MLNFITTSGAITVATSAPAWPEDRPLVNLVRRSRDLAGFAAGQRVRQKKPRTV